MVNLNVKTYKSKFILALICLSSLSVFCQSNINASSSFTIKKINIYRPEALNQNGDIINYSFYNDSSINIKLIRNLERSRDTIIFNRKKFPISYCCKEKRMFYPVINLDGISAYKIKTKERTYFVFLSSYAGAAGKQSNYTVYMIFDISKLDEPLLYVKESYLGSVKSFSVDSFNQLVFSFKENEKRKSKMIVIK